MNVKTALKAGKLIGDLAEQFTRATGLDRLAEKYTAKTGQDCGCEKRHAILDHLFPY